MISINLKLDESQFRQLEQLLDASDTTELEAVVLKNATQMLTKARQGYTPISTEKTRPGGPHGELMKSSMIQGGWLTWEMGYTKEYAPHVEYGHRTRNGGWVPGQFFLKRLVDEQEGEFTKDIEGVLNAKLG